MIKKKLCDKCKVFLHKVYVGKHSANWDYCVSCPECHIVYDLIPKNQKSLSTRSSGKSQGKDKDRPKGELFSGTYE